MDSGATATGSACRYLPDLSAPRALFATPPGTRGCRSIATLPSLSLCPLQKCPNRNLQGLGYRDESEQVQTGITRFDLDDCSLRQAATLCEIRARLLETHSPRTHGGPKATHECSWTTFWNTGRGHRYAITIETTPFLRFRRGASVVPLSNPMESSPRRVTPPKCGASPC